MATPIGLSHLRPPCSGSAWRRSSCDILVEGVDCCRRLLVNPMVNCLVSLVEALECLLVRVCDYSREQTEVWGKLVRDRRSARSAMVKPRVLMQQKSHTHLVTAMQPWAPAAATMRLPASPARVATAGCSSTPLCVRDTSPSFPSTRRAQAPGGGSCMQRSTRSRLSCPRSTPTCFRKLSTAAAVTGAGRAEQAEHQPFDSS